MKKLLILLIPVLLLSCNCTNKTVGASGTLEGNWELTYISGTKIAFGGLYPNEKPTINFELAKGRFSGKNSCNNYSGKLTLDWNKVNINKSTIISTRMFCEGDGEKAFMNMLEKINSYTFEDDGKIVSFTAGDSVLMRFSRK